MPPMNTPYHLLENFVWADQRVQVDSLLSTTRRL